MSPPTLKQFEELTEADFQQHPVWIGVHGVDDEEAWYDESDEETFRPCSGPFPLDESAALYLVAATATFADGSDLPGFFFLTPGEPELADIGYSQPNVLAGGKAWSFYAGMFGFRDSYADEFAEATGKQPSSTFPILFHGPDGVSARPLTFRLQGFGGTNTPRPARSWWFRLLRR